MPERKTLNEDLFYRGSSANLPRLHTCENKVPFWDFSQFAVTIACLSKEHIFSFVSFDMGANACGSSFLTTQYCFGVVGCICQAGEEARRELHKNDASHMKQVLAATPYRAPTIRPPASHYGNYPS